MKTWRRRLPKIGALLGGAALLWSCVAPILSVPPPSSVAFTVSTTITDTSGAQYWISQGGQLPQAANAVYYIRDEASGSGVIATARNDGSFTAPPMPGTAGDHVLVNYQTPYGDYSDSACFVLSDAPSAAPCP